MLTFTELPPHRTYRTWEAQENDFTYRLECHEHAEAEFWTLTVAFEGRPLATTEVSAADAKAMLHKRTEDGDAELSRV